MLLVAFRKDRSDGSFTGLSKRSTQHEAFVEPFFQENNGMEL
jgi:hypothetical protein